MHNIVYIQSYDYLWEYIFVEIYEAKSSSPDEGMLFCLQLGRHCDIMPQRLVEKWRTPIGVALKPTALGIKLEYVNSHTIIYC